MITYLASEGCLGIQIRKKHIFYLKGLSGGKSREGSRMISKFQSQEKSKMEVSAAANRHTVKG